MRGHSWLCHTEPLSLSLRCLHSPSYWGRMMLFPRVANPTQHPLTIPIPRLAHPSRLATAAATVAVALTLGPTALAAPQWTDSNFYNPSGNIQCFYDAATAPPSVACQTHSNFHVVWMDAGAAPTTYVDKTGHYGLPSKSRVGWWKVGHVLGYGQTWQSHQFSCLSTYQGMRCWTASLTHGFFINAWEVTHY